MQVAPIILKIYSIEYFKTVFLNIYKCVYKTLFANPVTYKSVQRKYRKKRLLKIPIEIIFVVKDTSLKDHIGRVKRCIKVIFSRMIHHNIKGSVL